MKWIVGAVVLVVIIVIAWFAGWLGTSTSQSPSGSAAVSNGVSLASDTAIANLLTAIDTQVLTLANSITSLSSGTGPTTTGIATSAAQEQTVITLLNQLDMQLRGRVAQANMNATQGIMSTLEQNLGTANSQVQTVLSALGTTKKLDPLALRLTSSQLQAGLTALKSADASAKAVARMIATSTTTH